MRRAALVVIAIAGCRAPRAASPDGSIALPDAPRSDAMPDAMPDALPDAIVVAPLAFGTQHVGDVRTASTWITNHSAASVAIHRIHVTGTELLVQSSTCGTALAAAQSCQVTVELYARAPGAIAETLTVDTDRGTSSAGVTAFVSLLLVVYTEGSGTGHITSSPAGIDCPGTCFVELTTATSMTLTATPDPGSTFRGWLAPGCGASPTCVVNVASSSSATALFLSPTDRVLQIAPAGTAPVIWSVETSSALLHRDEQSGPQTVVIPTGTSVQLEGLTMSVWVGMTGACTTSANLCTFTMQSDSTVTMTANLRPHEAADVLTCGRDSVNIDGQGNLYAICYGLMKAFDAAGNLRWTRLHAGTVLVAPDDEVAVAGDELDWLDGNGDIATAVPWMPGTPPASVGTANHVARPYAITPDGSVVRVDGMSLQEYSKAGLVWSVDLPLKSIAMVAVGADRTIVVAITEGAGAESGPVHAYLVDPTGAPLSSFVVKDSQYDRDALALDGNRNVYWSQVDGGPDVSVFVANAVPRRFGYGEQSSANDTNDGLGVGVSSGGNVWWVHDAGLSPCYAGFVIDELDPTSAAVVWTEQQLGFRSSLVLDCSSEELESFAVHGSRAVVGGSGTGTIDWVQVFTE
jgi:hypothetical protein